MLILAAHLAGDFLLQSGWMAYNKKLNIIALLLHTSIYTLLQAVAIIAISYHYPPIIDSIWWILGSIFISHAVIDKIEFCQNDEWDQKCFWVDQSWHAVTLAIIYWFAGLI